MIKILGMAAVFIAGSCMGIMQSRELTQKVKRLDLAENALMFIGNEMDLSGTLLCDILKQSKYLLFERAAEYIEEKGIKEGFEYAIIQEKLPPEEKEIFMRFGEGMAAQDRNGQIKNIKLCSKRISELKKFREERKNRLSKLYAASGILGSIALIIIFI